MSKEELNEIIKNCKSKSDVCRELKYNINGYGLKKVNDLISKYEIDISHFDNGKSKKIKYELITKVCPVCNKEFLDKKGHKRQKTTCSYACSNKHFRAGESNGNWKQEAYRTTCFLYHEHECVVCKEKLILDVHHYDGNRDNNEPENLIPICPTHHTYWHSRYKYLVESIVNEYRDNFIKGNGGVRSSSLV